MTRTERNTAVYEFLALVTFGFGCIGMAIALGFL